LDADWDCIEMPACVATGGPHPTYMFVVSEAEAAAIRAVFELEGEMSAAIELRRLFPWYHRQCEGADACSNYRRMDAVARCALRRACIPAKNASPAGRRPAQSPPHLRGMAALGGKFRCHGHRSANPGEAVPGQGRCQVVSVAPAEGHPAQRGAAAAT
jgi:hypothetical protein